VSKQYSRTPYGYDGSQVTAHQLQDLLPQFLGKIGVKYQAQPKLILEAWPTIIGEKLQPMTQAVRFDEGILYVKVKTSTLLSILSNQQDKQKIIAAYKNLFPNVHIRNIMFKIG
jgi:hypothetical protein